MGLIYVGLTKTITFEECFIGIEVFVRYKRTHSCKYNIYNKK